MVEKKEIIFTDLFVSVMQNCRRHFYINNGNLYDNTLAWEQCLKEHSISWDFMDRFYYEDEQLLGLFILKWS